MTSTPANANGHGRRQVRRAVLATETHCALCGELVDKTLTMEWGKHSSRCRDAGCPGCVPHPMRAEVDEIIPRAEGGSPTERSNTQLAHRICNLNKSLTSQGFIPTTVPRDPFAISGTW